MRYNNREPTNQKKIAWWQRMTAFLLCCGMIANFVIPSDFVLPAIAEEETEELVCAIEEHTHSPDCYELICEDNSEEHEHTDECYELICGMEEHVHNEECYQYEEEETAAEQIPETESEIVTDTQLEFKTEESEIEDEIEAQPIDEPVAADEDVLDEENENYELPETNGIHISTPGGTSILSYDTAFDGGKSTKTSPARNSEKTDQMMMEQLPIFHLRQQK